jgi:hypothetical protein
MPAYRSAQGKMVDMSVLAAKNEKVRAVGNMNVNARGDVIDENNNIIKDNTRRVKNSYQKVINNKQVKVAPQPVAPAAAPNLEKIELTKEEKELFDDDEDFKK